MAETPGRDTLMKVAQASGVGFGTVRRCKNADANITVQNLDMIARCFHRGARDLLAPPIDSYAAESVNVPPCVMEPAEDERLLLSGFRVASAEIRNILLLIAREAQRRVAP